MSSTLRTIVLVGPRLAGAVGTTSAERAYAWTATLKLAFQGKDRLDRSVVNSTQGIRVVLQSPQADVGRGTPGAVASQHDIDVPLMAPQLLQLVAGPTPIDSHPIVQFCAVAGSAAQPPRYALLPGAMLEAPNTRGMAGLLAVPDEAWPMPQSDAEIDVPRMRLVEGRLSVLIDVTQPPGAPPFGFLGLVQDKQGDGMLAFANSAAAGSAKSPFVRLPTHDGSARVRIELTPDGIEFDAEVADPGLSLVTTPPPALPAPLRLRLRLSNRLDAQGRDAWALYPVDDGTIEPACKALKATLGALQHALAVSGTLEVGIDTHRPVPAVCWPLGLSADALRPVYQVDGATSRSDWCIELGEGLATVLAADPDEGGELKTTSNLAVDFVRFTALGTGSAGASIRLDLQADRRRGSIAATKDGLAPPVVSIDLEIDTTGKLKRKLGITSPKEEDPVTWTLDEHALAAELVARYTRAGVQPERAATTYAFVPVNDGWLQWPLPLPPAAAGRDAPANTPTNTIPLDGDLVFALDPARTPESASQAEPDRVGGRRVRLTACDKVTATASFKAGTLGGQLALQKLTVNLLRCTGKASGLMWFATASPTPAEILPSLAAGPLALQSAWLDFGRWQRTVAGTRVMQSTPFNPRPHAGFEAITLTLNADLSAAAPGKAVLWRNADGLPVVTAMAMTRTSEGGTVPLSTRQLLPHEVDLAATVTLTFQAGALLPDADVSTSKLLHEEVWGERATFPPPASPPDIWSGVPLVAVTLPGVEFQASAAPFEQRAMRLQFGLPVLDELWALTRLPQTDAAGATLAAPGSTQTAVPTPPPATDADRGRVETFPTSLDLDALRGVWLGARDQLLLTRTQASLVSPGWIQQKKSDQPVTHLFEGATWQTSFALTSSVTLGGRTYPFGSYDIGGPELHGNAVDAAGALAGYSGRFRLTGHDITPVPDGPDDVDTLRISGFAAALLVSPLAGKAAWRDTRGAITARKPSDDPASEVILRDMGSALQGGYAWQRATLRKPIQVSGPDGRSLAFWFRDLPLADPAKQGDATVDASLVKPIAFRPGAGDQALGRAELAVGPTPDVLDSAHLPSSTYEWRFAVEPAAAGGQASYVIGLGALSFRPLRLVDVTLDQASGTPAVARIAILGTLAATPSSTDDVPFGDDMACATGSAVVLTLQRASDGSLSFARATWRPAQLDLATGRWTCLLSSTTPPTISLRLSEIAVNIGSSTSALLTLTLDGKSDATGRPTFASAKATVVLFGQLCAIDGGTVDIDAEVLRIDFKLPATATSPKCGLQVSEVGFVVSGASSSELTLVGAFTMRWTAASTASVAAGASLTVISLSMGGAATTLQWLNHAFTGGGEVVSVAAVGDHASGLLQVDVAATRISAFAPVAGMDIPRASGKACVRVVFPPRPASLPFAGALDASCALGLLDFTADPPDSNNPPPTATPIGGVTAFRHVVRLDAPGAPVSSDIDLDIYWTTNSLIEWPLQSVAQPLPPLSEASGQATSFVQSPDPAPRRHRVRMVVKQASLDTALLCWKRGARAQVSLEHPWALRARARHEIRHAGDAETAPAALAWTAIEHVVIAGGRALVEAALRDHVVQCAPNETRDLAFTPRYRTASAAPSTGLNGEKPQPSPAFAKAGLALRQYALAGFPTEPIADALTTYVQFGDDVAGDTIDLVKGGKDWIEGLVASGAGPVAIRVPQGDKGYFLSLPWIAMLTTADNSLARIMPKLHQAAPAGSQAIKWSAPDVDLASSAPLPLSFAPSMTLALRTDTAANLDGALDDALASVRGLGRVNPGPSRALMAVEQVFLQPADAAGRVSVEQQPLWLRSLLTLRNVLIGAASLPKVGAAPDVEQIVVSGRSDGIACRLSLSEPSTRTESDAVKRPVVPGSIQLLALGQAGLGSAVLGTADTSALLPVGRLDAAPLRVRLMARADTLVGATLCAVVSQRPDPDGGLQWASLDRLALRDDPILPPSPPLQDERSFASPNLGWPTTDAASDAAAAASLGMGDDRPFQDKVVPFEDFDGAGPASAPDVGDVKTYGSGFSGRVASLSLPARADPRVPKAAAFYVHGHKTLLAWPSQLALAAPPARHLSASQARLRLPGVADSMKALRAIDASIPAGEPSDPAGMQPCAVQPLVPPNIERTTYGSRPGAMHVEFDALGLCAWTAAPLVGDARSPAYPGHIGPMLTRQVRAPRGVELPRLPLSAASQPLQVLAADGAHGATTTAPTMVETHGRRTFVAADDFLESTTKQGVKLRQPRPFRLFDGVANVLRTATDEGQPVSLHLVARGLVQMLGAADLRICIEVTSAKAELRPADLKAALVALGLLPAPDAPAPMASLTVSNSSAAFAQVEVSTSNSDTLLLTLRFASDSTVPSIDANAVCRLLESADGDTPVVLTYVGARSSAPMSSTANQPPAADAPVAADAGGAPGSPTPAPAWIIKLRMPNAAATELAQEPRQKLVFRLPVQPRGRAAMAVRLSTLVFGDPAFDRLLSGPGAGSQQRDSAGDIWKLAFDRFVYSLNTPLYFAFGCLLPTERRAKIGPPAEPALPAGIFDPTKTSTARLSIERLRGAPGTAPSAVGLCIAGVAPAPDKAGVDTSYELTPATAYALTLDALRTTGAKSTFDLQAGDVLIFSLTRYAAFDPAEKPKIELQLQVTVRLAAQSVVPPSPAVYSLVTADFDPSKAVVALHAARPLPQRIEMPYLLEDLALGHIRRSALFEWTLPRASADAVAWATLVKIDSAGGGQVPSQIEDIVRLP